MKRISIAILSLLFAGIGVSAQNWIETRPEAKPYTRWWWLGSAVDTANISYNLNEYARAGIGGVEITPIYGVQGNDKNDIPYLSPKWMKMLAHVETTGAATGIETNMSTGTGWPFGGPLVSVDDAAAKAIFQQYDVDVTKQGQTLNVACTDAKQQKFARLEKVMAYKADKEGRVINHVVVDLTSATDKTTGNVSLAALGKGKWHIVALHIGRTRQMVKRAAPGGEGYVIDHFNRDAVARYLARFDTAFVNQGVRPPHTFFNDSYEVYGADWTPLLLDEFAKRRGYSLEDHFPEFLLDNDKRTDDSRRIISDYRQTLGELLLENFTSQWTGWAHKHGAITRNQAHGSPANLIDVYAEVDIPECEGFGLSDFNIKGLRRDPGFTKKNDSDISMLKYASSGAHISGKKYTSSETFTWLTEHFRTSLSQCKPDLDLLFVSGVNHVFFHGSCYSPREAEWPGWRFYASVDMTPANSQWADMSAFTKYIERCQAFLQWGEPDNDLLVYLPYYDMIYEQPDRLALFDIHSMERRAPKFIHAIQSIIRSSYDVDYISDKYLAQTTMKDGRLTTTGKNKYAGIIVPDVRFMPLETLSHILDLARQGAVVVFIKSLPQSVPGYYNEAEQEQFDRIIRKFKKETDWGKSKTKGDNMSVARLYGKGMVVETDSYDGGLTWCPARPEHMRKMQGLSCIRRSNPDGYHYFVSNLQAKDVDSWILLGVEAKEVAFYNPLTGAITKAETRTNGDKTEVRMQLASGESIILRTFTDGSADKIMAESNLGGQTLPKHKYLASATSSIEIDKGWTLSFKDCAPMPVDTTINVGRPVSWTTLGNQTLNTMMGTGVYTVKFDVDKKAGATYILDLGDVRESARVVLNGQPCGTLFSVPYRTDVTSQVKHGENTLVVEVTNLGANRIAELDRKGTQWRKFKEINVVDLNYKKTTYSEWTPVPSGLNSEVKLLVY